MAIGRRLRRISKLETDVTMKKVKLVLAEEPLGTYQTYGVEQPYPSHGAKILLINLASVSPLLTSLDYLG